MQQGKGTRCYGYQNDRFIFCTRPETGSGAPFSAGANAYRHHRYGLCSCGITHGYGTMPTPLPRAERRQAKQAAEQAPLDPDTLHAVLTRYMELCRPLRPEHIEYERQRGEADLQAAFLFGYGSLPLGYAAAQRVIDTLVREFGERIIVRTPGFYRNRRNGRLATHTATKANDAIVIPLRDEQGRITAITRQRTTGDEGKYRLFVGVKGNTVYTISSTDWKPDERHILPVIEGIHKANTVAAATGARVFAMPAAHFSEQHAAAVQRIAPAVLIEAHDADKFTNPPVARMRKIAHRRMTEIPGVETMSAVWEADAGKGLDDLAKNGGRPRFRTVARRATPTARKPYPIPTPGAVPAGAPLDEIQLETRRQIREIVSHRRKYKGTIKVMAPPPGVGKSTSAAEELGTAGATARILVATHSKAREYAEKWPSTMRAISGRNVDNCQNFPVVKAARDKGFAVSETVCHSCPFLEECRQSGYYSQFRQPGTLVAPAEMLLSGEFMRGGELVVLDDVPLERVLIEDHVASTVDVMTTAALTGSSGPLWPLLETIARAADLSAHQDDGLHGPAIGARAFDIMARAAGSVAQLRALIDTVPDDTTNYLPGTEDGAPLTVEDIEAAPPAFLSLLVRLLKEELPAFLGGGEFNSGIEISGGSIKLRAIRPSLLDRKTRKPILQDRTVLVLDATPVHALVERFARDNGLKVLPAYAPAVRQPANVKVVQLADAFLGKSTLTRKRITKDGSEVMPGQQAALRALENAMREYPGDRVAVVCPLALKDHVIKLGIPAHRVLHYFGNRGVNAIEDADVLFVIGKPERPDTSAFALAHVLHKGEVPVKPHTTMTEVAYGGYRGPEGAGRAITVPVFEDERVQALHRAGSADELFQSLHRARLFRVRDAQTGLWEEDDKQIARTVQARQRLTVVLLTAQPVPGLRVDELIYDFSPTPNELRHQEAMTKVRAAVEELEEEGVPVTIAGVARAAGVGRNTAAAALQEVVRAARWPLEEDVQVASAHRVQMPNVEDEHQPTTEASPFNPPSHTATWSPAAAPAAADTPAAEPHGPLPELIPPDLSPSLAALWR